MNTTDLDELVHTLFCSQQAVRGRYQVPGDASIAEARVDLVPNLLYRYELQDEDWTPVVVQVYPDLPTIGGMLWEQERRVLMRVNALNHPALPEIVDGGYEPLPSGGGVAFVLTKGARFRLVDDDDTLDSLRADPLYALREFGVLIDAVAQLHSLGVVHRNLWPGAVDVQVPETSGQRPNLVLARFEMSTLISNLMRTSTADTAKREVVREVLLSQGTDLLRYCSPERLSALFPEQGTSDFETERSDIFGLGAMMWEWFVGPMPDDLRDLDLADGASVLDRCARLRDELRRTLRLTTRVPSAMSELLLSMLNEDAENRPPAGMVAARLTERDAECKTYWSPELSDRAYLVTFMPREFVDTIYKWGWLDTRPTDTGGPRELAELIERDLHRATALWSEYGAHPYVPVGSTDTDTRNAAKHVLVGNKAAWFCQPFRPRVKESGSLGAPVDDMLIVKYAVKLDSRPGRDLQQQLQKTTARQPVPAVEAFPVNVAERELAAQRKGRPSWATLLASTHVSADSDPEDLVRQQAIDWLLEFQRVELQAREYPFVRLGDGRSNVVRLQYDDDPDKRRRHKSSLLSKYSRSAGRRPPFAAFFADIPEDVADNEIDVLADDSGRPGRTSLGTVRYRNKFGDDVIEVIRARGGTREIPERGWLRPASDRGSDFAYHRQLDARTEFLDKRALTRNLRKPRAIVERPDQWLDAGEGLLGGADQIVAAILGTEPFYALQGPPGTGKTEVASRAIAAYLRREVGARVLIAAQSNFALDNLAERILGPLTSRDGRTVSGERELLLLRIVAKGGEDRVSDRLKPFQDTQVAVTLRKRLIAHAKHREADDPRTRELLGQWAEIVNNALPELLDRVRRGADLVFATCISATDRNLHASGVSGLFEWVVIEEAAKAWPTELAIPLIRGLRWTLIGDHRQLGAHRRREVVDFLSDNALDDDTELRAHGERADEYAKVFDLFSTLFEPEPPVPDRPKPRPRPLSTLTTQFRMNRPIGELVSRVFYPVEPYEDNDSDNADDGAAVELGEGLLRTGREEEPHGMKLPSWLNGRSLVWLDTAGLDDCSDEPAWANKGEGAVLDRLVAGMRPTPAADRIAVLSPYRQQLDVLRGYPRLAPSLSTIHAFQGKEADIVIVSLVRDTQRGAGTEPWRHIGHLNEEQLVNVMLSRARQLLVLVGRFDHFQKHGPPFWRRVCLAVNQYGVVVPAPGATL